MAKIDPSKAPVRRTKASGGAPAKQAPKPKSRTAPADDRNVYQRVAAAMGTVTHVLKEQQGYSYKYASEEDIILAVRPALLREGVIFVASVLGAESEHIANPKKPDSALVYTVVKTQGRFVNIDKPEDFIECVAFGHGLDRGDKSIGMAETYAFKELLRHGVMCLATGEDPERHKTEGIPAHKRPQEAAGTTPSATPTQDVPLNGRQRMEPEAEPVHMEFGEMDKDLSAIIERATQGLQGSRMPEFRETRWRAVVKTDMLEMITEFRETLGGKPEDAPDGSTCPNSQLARMAGTEEYRAQCFMVLHRIALAVGLEEVNIMGAFQRVTSQRLWKCSGAEFEEGFMEFIGDVSERLMSS